MWKSLVCVVLVPTCSDYVRWWLWSYDYVYSGYIGKFATEGFGGCCWSLELLCPWKCWQNNVIKATEIVRYWPWKSKPVTFAHGNYYTWKVPILCGYVQRHQCFCIHYTAHLLTWEYCIEWAVLYSNLMEMIVQYSRHVGLERCLWHDHTRKNMNGCVVQARIILRVGFWNDSTARGGIAKCYVGLLTPLHMPWPFVYIHVQHSFYEWAIT